LEVNHIENYSSKDVYEKMEPEKVLFLKRVIENTSSNETIIEAINILSDIFSRYVFLIT